MRKSPKFLIKRLLFTDARYLLYLKRLALEKLEDEYDMQVIKKYEEEKRKGKVKIYPIEELFEELDV